MERISTPYTDSDWVIPSQSRFQAMACLLADEDFVIGEELIELVEQFVEPAKPAPAIHKILQASVPSPIPLMEVSSNDQITTLEADLPQQWEEVKKERLPEIEFDIDLPDLTHARYEFPTLARKRKTEVKRERPQVQSYRNLPFVFTVETVSTKHRKLKLAILSLLVLLIPLNAVYGYLNPNPGKSRVNPRKYAHVLQLQKAYTTGNYFVGYVAPEWKKENGDTRQKQVDRLHRETRLLGFHNLILYFPDGTVAANALSGKVFVPGTLSRF